MACSCAGNRTVRHNAIRNVVFEEATDAALRAEREKANLLPSRPDSDRLPSKKGNGRRPADVWIPHGASGKGEAFDFAISSGMQSDLLHPVADTPELVFQRYEKMKRDFKNTEHACETAGFRFVPLVIEAHAGGWSPLIRAKVDWIAKTYAACHNEMAPAVSLRIAQRISCTLQRENARAILQRSANAPLLSSLPSGWDEAVAANI